MTDIVERLRDLANANKPYETGKLWDGLDEAADEIEQLREQLHYANGTCDLAIKHRNMAEAEIEQLRPANADLTRHISKLYAEIERLRKELSYRVHTDEDIIIQNAEIERLRTALQYVADVSDQSSIRIYCRNTLTWSEKTTQDASDRATTSLDWPEPMTDIVERLCDPEQGLTSSDRFHLHKEAAAEIERLRMQLQADAMRAQNEITHLRELKTSASRELLNVTKGLLDSAEVEIEQLTALVQSMTIAAGGYISTAGGQK